MVMIIDIRMTLYHVFLEEINQCAVLKKAVAAGCPSKRISEQILLRGDLPKEVFITDEMSVYGGDKGLNISRAAAAVREIMGNDQPDATP